MYALIGLYYIFEGQARCRMDRRYALVGVGESQSGTLGRGSGWCSLLDFFAKSTFTPCWLEMQKRGEE